MPIINSPHSLVSVSSVFVGLYHFLDIYIYREREREREEREREREREEMGLYCMPSPGEAGLPFALLANALLPVVVLIGGVRWAIFKVMGFDDGQEEEVVEPRMVSRAGDGVHVTRFKFLRQEDGVGDCCVCLHGFEGEEEVSEVLACKHLFHKVCLDRWLGHLHSTCPLCRSML